MGRLRSTAAVALALALLAGCESNGPTPTAPEEVSPSASAAQPDDSGGGESPTAGAAFAPGRVTVALQRVVSGLDQPVGVTGAGDGSGRLFVLEQPGRIRTVKDGQLVARPFLDIRDRVSCCGERGLLGIAFPPDFDPAGGTFYIDYTDKKGDTAIASVDVDGSNPDLADASSLRVILHIAQPFANHNGGGLAFGPDDDLYIGMGDGGSGGDPQGNGQRLDTLLGKLLRIDVSPDPGSTEPYGIPTDNPFAGESGDRPEIWAYGLRNPWRFSFDRETGDLWIGDVGQNRYEEIDRQRAGSLGGANFGWNIMEGQHCFPGGGDCNRAGLVLPLAEVDHSAGDCAIIGGYVYRGSDWPALVGGYVFGDECSGINRGLVADGPDEQKPAVLLNSHRTISSFGEDDDGELYLTDLGSGELYQVTGTPK